MPQHAANQADDLQVTIYTPESALASPGKMLRDMFRDLATSRELAWRLAVRDIRAQYRQTFLGLLWVFIGPIVSTLTWIFLQGTGIIAVGDTALPYPVYVFTGTMLWSFFTDSLNSPINETNAAKSMLVKLNFPREALLVAGFYKILFNGGIKILVLLIALAVLGINPGWGIVWFPFGILSLILFGTTLGLLITPIGMLYTDVGRIIGIGSQFLMYITPVVFAMPKDGWVNTLFLLNPLTPLITTTRGWLTGQPSEWLVYFIAVNAIAAALFLVVWGIYRLAMPILIERMGG